jgi:hypothetical protein
MSSARFAQCYLCSLEVLRWGYGGAMGSIRTCKRLRPARMARAAGRVAWLSGEPGWGEKGHRKPQSRQGARSEVRSGCGGLIPFADDNQWIGWQTPHRRSATLSPSDGERDGVRGVWRILPFVIGNWSDTSEASPEPHRSPTVVPLSRG